MESKKSPKSKESPAPELTEAERQFWHEQAAYWGVIQEDAERAVAYARNQRHTALEKLGMVRRIDTI